MSGTFPIGPSGTPGWPPGYVPSATEWSSWWSNKLDSDDAKLIGAPWLSTSGGTMTGDLVLVGMPTTPLMAATKSYVDQFTPVTGPFLPQSGGTMTGVLTLALDPTGEFDAATKRYVDAAGTTANNALTIAQGALSRTGGTMSGPIILSGDPVNALAAATKQYVDRFVPLSGATMTGTLATNATSDLVAGRNLYATSVFIANSFNGWEWQFTVDSNGTKIQTYRAGGWTDNWNGITGTRNWNGPGGGLMNLTGSGNLNVLGTVNATTFTGTTFTGTTATLTNVTATSTVTGGYVTSTGSINAAISYTGGAVNVTGRVQSNDVWSNGLIYASNDSTLWMGGSGTNRIFNFSSGFQWLWQTGGTLNYMLGGYGAQWVMRSDGVCFNQLNAVGGYGAYQNLSDGRAKDDVADESRGLSVIMALRPVSYRRKGREGLRMQPREVGFIAHELRGVIPEAVSEVGIPLPDGSGGFDSEQPSLAIDTTPIIAALVNAVREITARLDALTDPAMRA